MSKFNKWFVAQFGKRNSFQQDDEVLADMIAKGDEAREEMKRRKVWDERRDAAESAWYVNDYEK